MAAALSVLLTALLFLIPWNSETSAQAQQIVLGYSGAGVSTDLRRVIEKKKIWEKNGLNVRSVYLNSGSVLARAMVAGDINLSDSDVPSMLNIAVSGLLDLKVIAVTINRLEHYFVVNKAILKPEDLKGKRVAVSSIGSASDATTRMVLRFWKLNPDKDVTILSSGNTPTRVAALAVGHVDGAFVDPNHLHMVLATGCCRVLADLADLPLDYARFGISVPTSMIERQRETVRRILMAYIEGIQVFKTSPEVVFPILAKEEGTKDPKISKSVYERISRGLREYPIPEANGMQNALDSLANPKARGAKAEDFMDTSVVEEIKQSGFIDRLYGR
jgi:ABC-type nitrate/sulfonate/bicarbonate transport system substrate-binding protein